MSDLGELSALETADAIRSGQVSAVEVTQAALRRAETHGAAVGAFTVLAPELALAEARAIDQRVRGTARWPAAGRRPVPDQGPQPCRRDRL